MQAINTSVNQKLRADFERFIEENSDRFSGENVKENILKAYTFAEKAHQNMTRYSGEPYMVHPVEVAKIVRHKFGLGAKSVIAALLHDVVEKTDYTIEDLKAVFPENIISILTALQQIKKSEYFEDNTQASVFRQILLSVSDDIRVILIKTADKLHNLRTVNFLPPEEQKRIVRDALNIYAPLAHRLGLYDVKSEMEDLCLQYSNPYIYKTILEKLERSKASRDDFIANFLKPVHKILQQNKIKYRIESRTKSVYSVWKKMQNKQVPFEEVYDIFAVRIIFTPMHIEQEKYEALFIAAQITDIYPEKADRTRNWLDKPKDTGYRAMHITVMSNEGKWVEVQIRSENMHEAAEYGFASHTKYKGIEEKKTEFDSKVREVLASLNDDNVSAVDFLDNLKISLFTSEIFVFTPKGKPVNLPKQSTALDFAFKIHTDLAFKSIAAKVNGTVTSLDKVLKPGDRVEIITSENQQPQKEWLNFVITHKALSSLKRIFRDERQACLKAGKETVEQLLDSEGVENYKQAELLLSEKLNLNTRHDLYLHVGEGKIEKAEIIQILKKYANKKRGKFWKLKMPFVKSSQNDEQSWREKFDLATCCSPLPGDKLKGLKLPGETKIQVHKSSCSEFQTLQNFGHEVVDVEWFSYTAISELTRFEIRGKDTIGVLNRITKLLSSELSVNVRSLNLETAKGKFTMVIVLLTKDEEHADNIQLRLSELKDVHDVEIRYS